MPCVAAYGWEGARSAPKTRRPAAASGQPRPQHAVQPSYSSAPPRTCKLHPSSPQPRARQPRCGQAPPARIPQHPNAPSPPDPHQPLPPPPSPHPYSPFRSAIISVISEYNDLKGMHSDFAGHSGAVQYGIPFATVDTNPAKGQAFPAGPTVGRAGRGPGVSGQWDGPQAPALPAEPHTPRTAAATGLCKPKPRLNWQDFYMYPAESDKTAGEPRAGGRPPAPPGAPPLGRRSRSRARPAPAPAPSRAA